MAPSNAATISACVSTGSSFHCSIGRAICLSSTLRASSTRMPSFRPACMIAPTAQKRRAATDCTGTGMLSQLRAKERRHQRSSSAISSRARASTARASLMYSGRRLVCQAGIGLAMISRIAGGLVPKVITWPSSAGNRGTIEWHQYLPRYRRQFIAGRLLRASKSVSTGFQQPAARDDCTQKARMDDPVWRKRAAFTHDQPLVAGDTGRPRLFPFDRMFLKLLNRPQPLKTKNNAAPTS